MSATARRILVVLHPKSVSFHGASWLSTGKAQIREAMAFERAGPRIPAQPSPLYEAGHRTDPVPAFLNGLFEAFRKG